MDNSLLSKPVFKLDQKYKDKNFVVLTNKIQLKRDESTKGKYLTKKRQTYK